VVSNDTDPDAGQVITAQLVQNVPASAGTVALAANGGFVFTPTGNYNGPVSFSYRAFDGIALSSNLVVVTLNIGAANDAPVANNDGLFQVDNNNTLVVGGQGVLGNDSDVDNDPSLNHPVAGQTLTASVVGGPASGSLTLAPNGQVTFTPTGGASGVARIPHAVAGGVATCN